VRFRPLLLLLVSMTACEPEKPSQSAVDWYRRVEPRDLNGDDRPDSILLAASGPRSDSLQIALMFIVGGKEAYKQTWESSYELIDPPSGLSLAEQDSLIRSHLDRILQGIETGPVDTNLFMVSEDSLAVTVARKAPHQITVSWGYESTDHLVWDSTAQRFVSFYYCC
jgi:hypothetical protein